MTTTPSNPALALRARGRHLMRHLVTWLPAAVLLLATTPPASGQHHPTREGTDSLDALVREALATHPEIQAARSRVEAAAARIPQAGALPDPTLSTGMMYVPLPDFDFSADGMTMLSVQLSQRFPPRGLRHARERAAEAELAVARAWVEVARWSVATRLQEAYFELLLVEKAEEVHHQTHSALEAFATSAEAAFTQGLAPQQDILRAQTELSAIEEHLAELRQRHSAARAEVNALLGRDSRAPIVPVMPERLQALLDAEPGPGLLTSYLTDAELGGGFPTLSELQARAVHERPELELARHRTEAARHQLDAARRDRRPGISITGGYSVRSARKDMISAGVSIDLPLFRGRKQDQAVLETQHTRRATELDARGTEREVRQEVAEAHADLLRTREQIILLEEGVIPQARATVESVAASYRSGTSDFVSLMEAYAVVFRNEIQLAHLAAELGRRLVRLERAVGATLTMPDTTTEGER